MITLFSILMCLAATTDHASCDVATASNVSIVAHEELASRLGANVTLHADMNVKGVTISMESSAGLYMWQRPPERPCGSADRGRCIGLMHVEVDGPFERNQLASFLIGYQGMGVGLRLHRRTVNWRQWEGEDAHWPASLCGKSDYDPTCYMADNTWQGIGAWQNTAAQVGFSRKGVDVKAWHVLGRYMQRSLPWPSWGVSARTGHKWWSVSVETSGGGWQSREGWVETSVRRGRLMLALHGGWIAPPAPGPAPFAGGLSLRIGPAMR